MTPGTPVTIIFRPSVGRELFRRGTVVRVTPGGLEVVYKSGFGREKVWVHRDRVNAVDRSKRGIYATTDMLTPGPVTESRRLRVPHGRSAKGRA